MSSRADVARLIKLSPVRLRAKQSDASRSSTSSPVVAVFAEDARVVADLRLPPARPGGADRHVDVVALPSIADVNAIAALAHSLANRTVVIFASSDLRLPHARDIAARFAAHAAAIGIVTAAHDAPDLPARIAHELAAAQARALPPTATEPPHAIAPATTAMDQPTAQAIVAQARALLARRLSETPAFIDTLVFWSLAAWAHARFDVSPRLILDARDPRADHARALRLLRWLAPAPRLVSRTIAVHVLPLIARERPTLLLDDAAGAMLLRRDMRALIAAGARADGTFLLSRTRHDARSDFHPCAAPLALATTFAPPDEILTHAIVLPMAPNLTLSTDARDNIGAPPPEALALRPALQSLAAWAAHDTRAPNLPPFLSAAARDTWLPLFTLAQTIGGDAPARIRAAASQLDAPDYLVGDTTPLALLRDIRAAIGIDTDADVPSKQIIDELTRVAESPWSRCDFGAPLSARGLARRLARFDLKPKVFHVKDGDGERLFTVRGYRGVALVGAFARYLADPVAIGVLSAMPAKPVGQDPPD